MSNGSGPIKTAKRPAEAGPFARIAEGCAMKPPTEIILDILEFAGTSGRSFTGSS